MYLDRSHASVIELEDWILSLSEIDRELVEEDIQDLLDIAASGRIPRPVEKSLKRLAFDPLILELRWTFRGIERRAVVVRQYHSEPGELPDSLVALHRHIKQWSGLSKEQRASIQNLEIGRARWQRVVGAPTLWA